MRFSCPTCSSSLKCSDDHIGQKSHCPKCGQRLRVPSPTINKTVLGNPDTSFTPTATFAVPAEIQLDPIISTKRIPSIKAVIITAICLTSCLSCSIAASLTSYVFSTNGAVPFYRPNIIGKWEDPNALVRVVFEFRSDGTCLIDIPMLIPQDSPFKVMDAHWSVEGFKKPVLVLDAQNSKFRKATGQKDIPPRQHFFYRIDDGTLTLTPIHKANPLIREFSMRPAK